MVVAVIVLLKKDIAVPQNLQFALNFEATAGATLIISISLYVTMGIMSMAMDEAQAAL